MTREQAEQAVERYGSQRKAAHAMRVSRKTIRAAMAGKGGKTAAKPVTAHDIKAIGKSLADFRLAYDKDTIIPAKVRAGIAALGRTGWDYEVQFARAAGVSLADLAAYRDQFAAFVVTLREGRRAWAGSVAAAKQMREMI
jgi:hypothetical protein